MRWTLDILKFKEKNHSPITMLVNGFRCLWPHLCQVTAMNPRRSVGSHVGLGTRSSQLPLCRAGRCHMPHASCPACSMRNDRWGVFL